VARYETWKVLRRRQRGSNDVPLSLMSPNAFRPLLASDMPLIFLCRNDLSLLPAFFCHYRALGVSRFIVVDDQSSDGSREWLAAQGDADVWVSTVRYKEAKRGRLWRERLLRTYGHDRWYVNVDADEFLVYDQCDSASILQLSSWLTAHGISRMAAPMLDMYPRSGLKSADYTWGTGDMPWKVADGFDRRGYFVSIERRFMSVRGGARQRVFGADVELIKYPLIYWTSCSSLGVSIHQPIPYTSNFSTIYGVLLHFKFFSDFSERLAEAIRDGQYYNSSESYKAMQSATRESEEIRFSSSETVGYLGVEQLVALGFMRELGPIRQSNP
jgi:glycosyltransferase involved in cell wall biosynthesis